jgi:hypothetical protein
MKRLTQEQLAYIAQACRDAAGKDENIRSTLANFESIPRNEQLEDHFGQRVKMGRELADLFDRCPVVHVDTEETSHE